VWQRVLAAVLLAMAAAGSFSQVKAQSITGSLPTEQLDGRVYVLRGDLGIFFSTGMDYLAAELNSRGLTAGVYNWENWIALADDAIARYRAAPDRTRILLVGHSRGGDGLIAMAWRLHSAHVPVALAVAFDPTRVVGKVPPNVERFINLYQSTNSLGGGAARPSRAFHGEYATVNLADRHEMTHITIDKMLALHRAIIPKFLEAVSFGSPPREAGVPIEYRVPQGARVEVWDSGIKVQASAEDTPEAVAERYGVPTWVVAQLNKLVLEEPVGSDQTLVVPRMVFAPATASLPKTPVASADRTIRR
jgi:pimeloyl-ACP methyl ester carboxylesterase